MSHFYGSMIGSRGEVTRCGTPNSGIQAHLRGWNLGVKVSVQREEGKDVVHLSLTNGSRNATPIHLASFKKAPDGESIICISQSLDAFKE